MADAWDVVGPQPEFRGGDKQAQGFRSVSLERTEAGHAAFDRALDAIREYETGVIPPEEAEDYVRRWKVPPLQWDAGPYPEPRPMVPVDTEPVFFETIDPNPGEAHPIDFENGGCTVCPKPEGVEEFWSRILSTSEPESTGNPKDAIGDTKPQMHLVPAALNIEVARAMADGARKYGPYNWRENPVRMTVYLSAIERHVAALKDGENLTRDSKVKHLAAIGANVAILLDAGALGVLLDDRPLPGPAGDLLEVYTEQAA